MIILATTTDKLDLITSASVTVDVHVSFQDYNGTDVTPGKQNTAITTAATTDILAAPASSVYRNAKTINIRNKHASTATDVTVRFNQNATAYELYKVTLIAGDVLTYVEGIGWFVYTAPTTRYYADSTGNTADIVANAADTYLLGLQLGGRLKTGSTIRIVLRMTKTAFGSAAPIWSIRVGTAGTTADTARLTFTGSVQTAAADTGTVRIDLNVISYGASASLNGFLDVQHLGTTTGFMNGAQGQTLLGGAGGTVAASAAHDLTGITTRIGISVNPGASAVWTHQFALMDGIGLTS